MSNFLDKIKGLARSNKKTIVLPEALDIRTLEATEEILKDGLANIILIGNEVKINEVANGLNISGATIIDPESYNKLEEMADVLVEVRKSKGLTKEEAFDLLKNPLFFAVTLVKMDLADGMVAGAANSTADVLRPALQIIKTSKGTKVVSTFFLMVVPNCEYGDNGIFAFADCGLNQNPNSEELASIAIDTAKSFEALTKTEPVVAMLSHSTMGSAKHEHVDKVIEAVKVAKETAPTLKVDGELQLDAAIVPSVGSSKAPNSSVAGKANVLVFPDLDSGNIGYKLVQRLANAEAYGPVTQGIAKPVNDLSRGCSSDDIVGVVALTAVQAQAQS